jgi:hypothetical protein
VKKILFAIAILSIVACSTKNRNGLYVGFEELCYIDSSGKKECNLDPANPLAKWYHKNNLSIEGDSVFLYQNPIAINKSDTSYSASDGGFYYFSGLIQFKGDSVELDLLQTGCDYCGVPIKVNKDGSHTKLKVTKKLTGTFDKTGLKLSGLAYKKVEVNKENYGPHHPPGY